MSGPEPSSPRAVLSLLRGCERRATELSRQEHGFDPVTYTEDFDDGSLVVTISEEGDSVRIAFYDPDADSTVVMSLDQLRRRLADL